MPSDVAARNRLTAAEYLAWEREQPERHQFFRGEVFAMAGGTPRHNGLCGNIVGLLFAALGNRCRVLTADQRIVAHHAEHYVYADASVVCGKAELQPGTNDVLTNPIVVVEVLSSSTEQYDRGLKWEGYQQIPSLTDYVLVSQVAARIEHYQREADGSWRFRVAEAGDHAKLADGTVLHVDAVYSGVFELTGEA